MSIIGVEPGRSLLAGFNRARAIFASRWLRASNLRFGLWQPTKNAKAASIPASSNRRRFEDTPINISPEPPGTHYLPANRTLNSNLEIIACRFDQNTRTDFVVVALVRGR